MTLEEKINSNGFSDIAIFLGGMYLSGAAAWTAFRYTANYFIENNDKELGFVSSSIVLATALLAGLKTTSYLLGKNNRRKAL